MIKIAIFASGKGSNARKLLEKSKLLNNISIELIITDCSNAGVINIAKEYKVDSIIIKKDNQTKFEHEQKILNACHSYHIEWIFLAGYMRILSQKFISHFSDKNLTKIINIHPSLLPSYKGLNAFTRAFNDKVEESGITVHFVNSLVDDGQVIIQRKFKRYVNDKLEDFIERGQQVEHIIYPLVLEKLDSHSLFPLRSS